GRGLCVSQALGCFLSWGVRRSCRKRLTFALLAVTALSVSGAGASLLASHNPPLHALLTAALVLAADLLTLGLLLPGSKHQSDVIEEEEEQEEQGAEPLSRWNQRLKSRVAQLEAEMEGVIWQLGGAVHQDLQCQLTSCHTGHVTHTAQVCSENGNLEGALLSPDAVNSPERVWRRLSVQLPILHHSYLPASTSSLFGSREAFVHHDPLTR
ncbi:gamma-aminobutyric acid type B receptor subunit 2-like, partial [Nelusetta ayraudi]|uniref:gamma-aminobutyric acid type B receptor subunit 2-like n=1 Tax=Nelusetta ayraudi TaxID=303726 RepID=UPI003F6EDE86